MGALQQLGTRLTRARTATGLSIPDLASRAQVSADRIEAFELGQIPLGSAQTVRLARVLGVPAAPFLHTAASETRAEVSPDVLLRAAAFGADLSDKDRDVIARGLLKARTFGSLSGLGAFNDARGLLGEHPLGEGTPWAQGYQLALDVRGHLPERTGSITEFQRLIEDRFGIFVIRHQFTQSSILGAAARARDARLIVVNSNLTKETTFRFVMGHELGHHVADLPEGTVRADTGDVEQQRFFMEPAPIERRASAFAAMFLAPRDAVAQMFGGPQANIGTAEAWRLTQAVVQRFGMGFVACTWHLRNLGYWSEDLAQTVLMMEANDRTEGFETASQFDGVERRVLFALNKDLITRARARDLIGGIADDLGSASLRAGQ